MSLIRSLFDPYFAYEVYNGKRYEIVEANADAIIDLALSEGEIEEQIKENAVDCITIIEEKVNLLFSNNKHLIEVLTEKMENLDKLKNQETFNFRNILKRMIECTNGKYLEKINIRKNLYHFLSNSCFNDLSMHILLKYGKLINSYDVFINSLQVEDDEFSISNILHLLYDILNKENETPCDLFSSQLLDLLIEKGNDTSVRVLIRTLCLKLAGLMIRKVPTLVNEMKKCPRITIDSKDPQSIVAAKLLLNAKLIDELAHMIPSFGSNDGIGRSFVQVCKEMDVQEFDIFVSKKNLIEVLMHNYMKNKANNAVVELITYINEVLCIKDKEWMIFIKKTFLPFLATRNREEAIACSKPLLD